MKKQFFLFLFFIPGMFYSQTIHKCYSKEAIDYQNSLIPNYEQHVNEQFEIAKQWSNNHTPTRSLYTIPVVFHIVYNNSEQNISDDIIQNQIDILNQDYARLNPDTVNTRLEFQNLVGSTNVRFVLAQVDPDGNPTSGITRTQTNMSTFGTWDLDFNELEKVKSTVDGGKDPWDQEHYLNIWVCDMSVDFLGTPYVMLLGYATPPLGLPNWPPDSGTEDLGDGVVLQYHAVGDFLHNTNDILPESKGRTAVHEVGHYLGLRHIWGDGDCTMDDGIEDTPDATDASMQDCNFNINSCNADVMGLGDLNDMVENFMDYSSELCQNSFTQNQIALMHGVLENQRQELALINFGVGIDEIENLDFNVFPNPTYTNLNFSSVKEMKNISIYNLNGTLLFEKEGNFLSTSLNVNDLSSGIYVVNVNFMNGQSFHKKISKK
ncbi:MAG: T9SS type A sorting domain-containing protein [Flavobacteriia bacterium]|nr:T9SS type A sorting domain-containing protein [Flavobacteriia bacterium]